MRPLLLAVAWLGVGTASAHAAPASPRWPAWPSEIDAVAEPLRGQARGNKSFEERDRVAAVTSLEAYATEVIAPLLGTALDDPSSQVRREALRICYDRQIATCVPPAASIWSSSLEPGLRMAALKVLALDPDPSRLAIILSALKDPGEQLRAHAAHILGVAPLSAQARKEVRAALLAKLSDPSALVRRRALDSLGLLGPGPGTLALTRLLEDPEPSVVAAAATALARYHDRRAAPALLRALEAPNETPVVDAILRALAILPGEGVAEELLTRLDDPPSGISLARLADAIGTRPNPEPELIEGLIARLREPPLRAAAVRALLQLGPAAAPSLREASRRGLEPDLALEVERLLQTLDAPDQAPASETPWPALSDVDAWRDLVEHPDPALRADAVLHLAVDPPAWTGPTIARAITRAVSIHQARGWTLLQSMITTEDRGLPSDATVAWARLQVWANDGTASPSDRCLAVAGLGAAQGRKNRRRALAAVSDLTSDSVASVRACATLALARLRPDEDDLALMLVDPRPGPRAAAALGLAALEGNPSPELQSLLRRTAERDPDGRVRTAARLALRRPRGRFEPWLVSAAIEPFAWTNEPGGADPAWLEVDIAGTPVHVPVVGTTQMRWGVVLLPSTRERARPEIVPPDPSRPGPRAP